VIDLKSGTFSRRCEHDIIASILNLSKEGATRTQIMYGANLSFTLLNKYLDFLIKNELLESRKKEGRILYFLGEKGSNFLSNYREIQILRKNKTKE